MIPKVFRFEEGRFFVKTRLLILIFLFLFVTCSTIDKERKAVCKEDTLEKLWIAIRKAEDNIKKAESAYLKIQSAAYAAGNDNIKTRAGRLKILKREADQVKAIADVKQAEADKAKAEANLRQATFDFEIYCSDKK